MARLLPLGAAVLLLAGCAPQVAAEDWKLEPIAFETRLHEHPGVPLQPGSGIGERVDHAFGMSRVIADGAGGFWAFSSGSWLHVGAGGETLARFNVDHDDPLADVAPMTALSGTEFIAVRGDDSPLLTMLDTATMTTRDVPVAESIGGDDPDGIDFGDFAFADVAAHEGAALVVRYQPRPPEYLDWEVIRIDLADGERSTLYSRSLTVSDAEAASPGLPPIDIDVDEAGLIYLATPSARIVLNPDGSERSVDPQTADFPRVAVRPDGVALWWGGESEPGSVHGVVVGGSAEARAAIERREACDDPYLLRSREGLRMTAGDTGHPLPFLCGANSAVWTGSSWVVATGGEGDGVLVRLTPPADLDN